MIRTQISFEKELYEQARKEARRQKISVAELCRRGLREVLGRRPQARGGYLRHLGSLSSGDRGASKSVDAVVYGREEP